MAPIATSLSIWINLGIWRINSSSIALHWAYFVPSRMAQKTSRQVQAQLRGWWHEYFVSIWHKYFVSICVVQKGTWSSFTLSMIIWSCSDSARVILLHCTFLEMIHERVVLTPHYLPLKKIMSCVWHTRHYDIIFRWWHNYIDQTIEFKTCTLQTLRSKTSWKGVDHSSASSFLGSQKLNYYQCDRLVYNFNCKHVLVHYNRSATIVKRL